MDPFPTWFGYPRQNVYKNLNISDLAINNAYVIANTSMEDVGIYTVDDDCVGCPYLRTQRLQNGQIASWHVNTSVPSTWRIMNSGELTQLTRNNRRGLICQLRPTIEEFGVYTLDIGRCELQPELKPINIYLQFFTLCLILLTAGCLYKTIKALVNCHRRTRVRDVEKNEETSDVKPPVKSVGRMSSLYVFRGLLVSMIIFLTTGGGGYSIFTRNLGGITLAECLFYAYVWTVGVKIPTTVDKAFSRGYTKCQVFTGVLKKSATLILIGTVIESTVNLDTQGLWCPLQRLSIAYFMAASTYALTVQRFEMKSKSIFCKAIANVMSLLWCWVIAGFFFALQIISITTFVSFNCQSNIGLETPNSDPSNITEAVNSCTRHKDMTELANHILMAAPETQLFVNSYFGFSRGFMGIMITIIQCLIGLKAGAVYHYHEAHGDRLKLWGIWATLFGAGGVLLAGLSIPLEFNLWPLSTVVLLSTSYILVFSLIYSLIESSKIVDLTVLRSFGVTSLAVLCGHLLFSKSIPFNWNISYRTHFVYLLQNVWIVSLWLVVGVVLMRKRVRFSI